MPTFKTEHRTFLAATPPPVPPAGPKEINELQRRLVEEGSNLGQVEAKSQEIEKEIARLKGGAPPVPNFDAPRELLLADIAVGKSKVDDLVRLDKEIFDAKKKHDSIVKGIREKVSPLESTTAGLRRKAAIHNRTIESLRIEHRNRCLAYLMDQAEEAGKEYVAAAKRMVDAHSLVVVLASLHVRAGGSNMVGKSGVDTIDIPPLGLESTRGTLPPLDPKARSDAFDAIESQILESLKAEGIAVPFPNVDVAAPAKVRVTGIGEGVPVSVMRPPELLRGPDGCPLPTHALTEAEE